MILSQSLCGSSDASCKAQAICCKLSRSPGSWSPFVKQDWPSPGTSGVFVGQSSCMLKAPKSSYLSTMQWEKCACVCFSYKVLCPSFLISIQKQSSLLKCDFARRKHGFIIPFICSVLGICSKSAGLWECKAREFYKMIWSWMRGLSLLSKFGWACGVRVGMLAIRLHSCLL